METWSRTTPWRQGKFLTKDSATALGLTEGESTCLVVVASHDCDLSQLPESEPYVEVVVSREITEDELNGNFTNGKNVRKLHLPIADADAPYIEIEVLSKQSVLKTDLAGHAPSNVSLNKPAKVIFQRWLASRYRRSAFPDEFEQRLTKHKLDKKIADAGKKLGSDVTALFFDLANEEADTDETYLLGIVIMYQTDDDPERAKAAATSMQEKIENAFKAKLYDDTDDTWQDIELEYVEVISDEALSYRMSQILKPWRLEYISLGADPQQPIDKES